MISNKGLSLIEESKTFSRFERSTFSVIKAFELVAGIQHHVFTKPLVAFVELLEGVETREHAVVLPGKSYNLLSLGIFPYHEALIVDDLYSFQELKDCCSVAFVVLRAA